MSTKKMEKNELWICLQLKIIKKLIAMKINKIISFLSYWWNERKWINNQIKCAGQCIDKIIGHKVDCLPPCSQFF